MIYNHMDYLKTIHFIEEADAALEAKELGISRVELAKRTAKIKSVCT